MTAAGQHREAPAHAPFQAKIASAALITASVVLLAACGTFMVQQWAVSREDARQKNHSFAMVTAELAAPALAAGDAGAADRLVQSIIASPEIASASLVDSTGKVVAAKNDPGLDDGPLEQVHAPVMLNGKKIGEVVLAGRPPSLSALAPRYVALTLALFFAAVGAALFLAQGLARRISAPVNRLSDAMREVASSGRFTPVAEDAKDDLFHSLAESFNHLLAKLDLNDKNLRRTLGELVIARDQADTANVAKSQFLANMSHEIRTPLNGVLAMAEVMDRDDLSLKQRDRLTIIRQSGELLLNVLNDVLDLSKIEAGKLELASQDFSIDSLAEQLRSAHGVVAIGKGLQFSVVVDPEAVGYRKGDEGRVRQILDNLLSNALKFTVEGGVSIRFSVTDKDALRLTVSDTGIGIAPAKLPGLFDKFTQADNSTTRKFGGSGLGLAICRELALLMGGTTAARSVEGEGSTFVVTLPLQRGETPAAAPAEVTQESTDRPLRILAAEDNLTNQKVLQALMEPFEVELFIVPDGREAVKAWRGGGYDVILMDIQMPVMDGVEACRAIRSIEATEGLYRTPILALTANAMVHQVEQYLAAGMDGHVAKPIEMRRLWSTIEQAVIAAEAARAAA